MSFSIPEISGDKMGTMLAGRLHQYGNADVLMCEEAPPPVPVEGEVLIWVHATSVNPFDCAVRAGYMAGYFSYQLPLIPGTDVSGVIEAVGKGVANIKPGDQVYTRAVVYKNRAYAEFVTVPARDVAPKPRSLIHGEAAALPHVTLTAWQALYEMANLSPGQTVLIHGAAGGVGHIATQLAHLRAAKVIGTASKNQDVLRVNGVDQVFDYSTTPFEEVVHDVDVVLDTIGGDTQQRSFNVLRPGGILLSLIQPPSEEMAAKYNVRASLVSSSSPISPTLTEVAALVDAGKIKPHVSTILSLCEAQKGHQMAEGKHTRGKIAIQVH
jgi:NADPH:quinone reductase-like Zn-dependent oxidoreductase